MKAYELVQFEEWIEDGNAVIIDNAWSTQCAQYRNRLETKSDLWKYFLKEFFDMSPDKYFFEEIKEYMVETSGGEWELKFKYASDWIVDLFKITRNAVHGRLAQGNDIEGRDYSIRIEKPLGRFTRYEKVYIKDLDYYEF